VSLKIRGTVEKYVLREATRHVLIDRVYHRHKHPFLTPPAAARDGGALPRCYRTRCGVRRARQCRFTIAVGSLRCSISYRN
jgi:hypothetical protein